MTQDPMVIAVRFLLANLDWMRHAMDGPEPYAVRAYAEIADCAGRIRGIVNGPAEQKYLGPCGSTVAWDDDGNEQPRDEPCPGDVFAPVDGHHGTCRACKARWATAARQEWLDGEVRQRAFRATHIADAYGVNIKTIRTWAARGQLVPHGTDGLDNQGRPRPTFNVGEVLDLAAADAARRATDQAKRARRAATRQAQGDDAA